MFVVTAVPGAAAAGANAPRSLATLDASPALPDLGHRHAPSGVHVTLV